MSAGEEGDRFIENPSASSSVAPAGFRIVIPPYSSAPVSKDEETNTKSDVALTEIQILARNSLRFAPGAASVDFSRY
jgi:hypothetical protein